MGPEPIPVAPLFEHAESSTGFLFLAIKVVNSTLFGGGHADTELVTGHWSLVTGLSTEATSETASTGRINAMLCLGLASIVCFYIGTGAMSQGHAWLGGSAFANFFVS